MNCDGSEDSRMKVGWKGRKLELKAFDGIRTFHKLLFRSRHSNIFKMVKVN